MSKQQDVFNRKGKFKASSGSKAASGSSERLEPYIGEPLEEVGVVTIALQPPSQDSPDETSLFMLNQLRVRTLKPDLAFINTINQRIASLERGAQALEARLENKE
jgi:hypothetical protein